METPVTRDLSLKYLAAQTRAEFPTPTFNHTLTHAFLACILLEVIYTITDKLGNLIPPA
jgi:hypothetical protein